MVHVGLAGAVGEEGVQVEGVLQVFLGVLVVG
jgi:hypothetical protein